MLYSLTGFLLVAFIALIAVAWRKLYPKPYPGIPYNTKSATRIIGDVPDLMSIVQKTNEFSDAIFTTTTQKLGTPIAQLLLPRFQKPLIVLEDPREIEDIVFRRNKEFDKAPMAINMMSSMFPHASISQYTTPKLREQKRLWVDVMGADFLHKAAAPNIHKVTLELLDLWRLKATTIYKGQPFDVRNDLQNATLDAIWVAIIGEAAGTTRHEIMKLRDQLSGGKAARTDSKDRDAPAAVFLKGEMEYIANTIARNSTTPSPKWASKLETFTPRYRMFRRTRVEVGQLEADELDTCMMDMVLRRQVAEAKKTRKPMTDPTQDQNMLDEMFAMLVGRTSGARAAAKKSGDGFGSRAGNDLAYFEPRRWLVRDEATGKEVFDSRALLSLAFGGGYRGCAGRKLATMEFRIVVTLLILNFEIQELPQKYKCLSATEKLFREPDMPYAKLRAL
ncbi:hypothetical protein PG996_010044 [Apiospora saccharicola]|uniref:Cytochrome P450 n=1 Tax=Apiospora saccharicola TaxID=335842 RepID=A0ABR1UMH4_9PEZI